MGGATPLLDPLPSTLRVGERRRWRQPLPREREGIGESLPLSNRRLIMSASAISYRQFENAAHWETAMAWDFETDPEFQKKLDWIEEFMAEEVEPLSNLGMAVRGPAGREKFIKPLQDEVKAQGLWAAHLGPELGGQGFGQLKLALMNEKLG